MVVFDVDSTLLDNRPRQARILREFGRTHGVEALAQVQTVHCDAWDLARTMANCGLTSQDIAQSAEVVARFWRARFFTSEYCVDDAPIPGAVRFVGLVRDGGSHIVYCTGRDEAMRGGTLTSFERLGFPLPGPGVSLLMRPTRDIPDDEWKERGATIARGLGTILAVFDNEPAHANAYRRAFPEALVVHVATDDAGRGILLDAIIPSIRDFVDD